MLNWPEWYQLSPSLLVVLMAPNSGNGVSMVRRVMLMPALGYKGAVQTFPNGLLLMVVQNGFLTLPPRFELLVCIAVVRELSVFKYLFATAFMLRVISMSVPWSPR